MEAMGFTSRQFINNLGTFSFYMAAVTIIFLLWLLIAIINIFTDKVSWLRRKLSALIFWNRLNQCIFESILIVSFCALIKFKYNLSFDS